MVLKVLPALLASLFICGCPSRKSSTNPTAANGYRGWATPAIDPNDHSRTTPNPAITDRCALARVVYADGTSHLLASANAGATRALLTEHSHWNKALDPKEGDQVRVTQDFSGSGGKAIEYDCATLWITPNDFFTCEGSTASGTGTIGYVDITWTVWFPDGGISTCKLRVDPQDN